MSSSSSAASASSADPSSEDTLSDLVAIELQPGHTMEFGTSRISSVRVQEMQQLGYFGDEVRRVPGAKKILEPEGELVVFEAFFVAGLRLPAHRFVVEVLWQFDVQVHQLTPNAVVALAKFVWAVASYGGQPSVEVFAKNYCLHWQKKKIGNKMAQFGSCTFTPRTRKTSTEVVEIVPCARNKWGNWWDFWFYVSGGEVEDLPRLPAAIMCSHCYVAFPPFEVAEDDEDEGALRYAARMSSKRDLVEEFIGYGVWPLAHGWVLGEVCPRRMPTLGDQLVRSPAFALDLQGQNPAAFVREVEAEAARIVGRYVPKTKALRSWDIRDSNVRLNRVFELNRLPYGGYPGDDDVVAGDCWGKRETTAVDEGPSWGAAPTAATKKRKLGTATEGLGVSNRFAVDLLGTCVASGERMSSPELRESSARMLEVTGGRWPMNVSIPWVAGEDIRTSRLAREMKIFPYGRNVVVFVSVVMEKDRQDASQKRRAFARVGDPRREVKMARGITKSSAPSASKPPPGAKSTAPSPSKLLPAVPAQERRPPSPSRSSGAEDSMDFFVDDYLVGSVAMFDAHTRQGLVGEFFLLIETMVQDRSLGNWLLSQRRWRLGRSPWRLGRRGRCRTRGPSSAPTTRSIRPPLPRTWRAQLRSS
jgi:hypothetical protein